MGFGQQVESEVGDSVWLLRLRRGDVGVVGCSYKHKRAGYDDDDSWIDDALARSVEKATGRYNRDLKAKTNVIVSIISQKTRLR